MWLQKFFSKRFKKVNTTVASPREIELLRQARAEASGFDPRTNSNGDSEYPITALNVSVSGKDGKGLKPVAFIGNPFANNQIDNINLRYEESADKESRLKDN